MNLFGTIISDAGLTGSVFFICTAASLLIGLAIAYLFSLNGRYSKSFLISLVLLPAIVQVVIMLVNGNIGAGVAVAGAFSLVRFRSAPGNGQEISSIFLVMAVGLATGMGYIAVAAVFALVVSLVNLILTKSNFGSAGKDARILKITIPEELDFEEVFDDIFETYTTDHELIEAKTTDLGSLYKLSFSITMKTGKSVKELIDDLRTRNGNLEISCGRPVEAVGAL